MTRLCSCWMAICLIFGFASNPCLAQTHCAPSFHNNPAPIWQKMGTINPYRRSYSQPVWHKYSRIQPLRTFQAHPFGSNHIPFAQGSHNLIETNAVNSTAGAHEQSFSNANIAPEMQLDSIEPVAAIEGELIQEADNSSDIELALDAQNSPSDQSISRILDAVISETDETVESEKPLDDDSEQSSDDNVLDEEKEQLEIELAELRHLMDATKERNLELNRELQRVRAMVEEHIVKEIKSTKGKEKAKKLIAEAQSKAKESAWEISKLRKEATDAKKELEATRKRAEKKQRELLARLEAVQAKLKTAAKNHEHESGHEKPEKAANGKK